MARLGVALPRGSVFRDKRKSKVFETNEKIIDYASHHHTDLMDLFLTSKCRFFIASTSGINTLPMLFRKPTLTVNAAHFGYIPSWSGKELFIIKKFWWRNEKRLLTIKEICQVGIENISTEIFFENR